MKVTIITITYNAARTLRRTLDSVLSQTWADIEHLIVDGASTDDTLAVARRYQGLSRHQVIIQSEPDHGLYDAMNKGLRLATGDYLVFLNAGDTLYANDTIETVVRSALHETPSALHETPSALHSSRSTLPAIIYGDTAVTDGQGRFLHMRQHRPPETLTWRSFRQGMLVCHQAFYVRTDIARSQPYDLRYRYSADVDWCIRVMKEADRLRLPIVNSHAVLANFEDGGTTTAHHRASLRERFQVMSTHYGLFHTVLLHIWFVLRTLSRIKRVIKRRLPSTAKRQQ